MVYNAALVTYYNNVSLDTLEGLAEAHGLDTCIDLKQIRPPLTEAKSILEVGPLYGRCIAHLLDQGFKGNITAVERSHPWVEYLQQRFSLDPNVQVVQQDFNQPNLNGQVDVALLMWATLCEFPHKEQARRIKDLHQLINSGGRLVIDTPFERVQVIGEQRGPHHVSWPIPELGTARFYIPDKKQISAASRSAGFRSVEDIVYTTTTGKERVLYILQK